MNAHAKPGIIRGAKYPSQLAAARALGISHSAISLAVRRGDLNNVGLTKRSGRVGKSTTVGGVTYPTRQAACDAVGVYPGKLKDILDAEKRDQQARATR